MWLYTIIAFVGTGVVSVLTIHSLTHMLVRVIGERKCLDTHYVNGCDWWPRSMIVSMVVAVLLWKSLGWLGLVAIPVGPMSMALLAGSYLRYGMASSRKKEFRVDDQGVRKTSDGSELCPAYLIRRSDYYQTGPGTGYCLYAISLKDGCGALSINGYVNREECDEVFARLVYGLSIPTLDVSFFTDPADGSLHIITLGHDWNDFLFQQKMSLCEDDWRWWCQFTCPTLGASDVVSVDRDELLRRITVIEAIRATAGLERVKQDIVGLRKLVESGLEIKATQHTHLSFEYTSQKLGKRVGYQWADGVLVAKAWT